MTYSEWKNAGSQVYYLGTGTSFDIASLFPNDYQNLTTDNFIIEPTTVYTRLFTNAGTYSRNEDHTNTANISKTYSNGILTITNTSVRYQYPSGAFSDGAIQNIKVYLVMGDIETVQPS